MKEIVLLTGVSGAGKSTAMGFMEDAGYYCIDNMPAQLISTFIGLMENSEDYSKIAIVADVRSKGVFTAFTEAVENLKYGDYVVRIIYLDIKTPEALKRYKLTRRIKARLAVVAHKAGHHLKTQRKAALAYHARRAARVLRSMSPV